MGFSFNGLSGATVTISGGISASLPAASATQTVIFKSVNNQNNGATVYTVTAGKTFYCLGMVLSSTATNVAMSASAGATQVGYAVATVGILCRELFTGGIVFTCPASTAITITGAGATSNNCTLWGYEA
jgi:hypothetical protein